MTSDRTRLLEYFRKEWPSTLRECEDETDARQYILPDAANDLGIDDEDLVVDTFDKWRRGEL